MRKVPGSVVAFVAMAAAVLAGAACTGGGGGSSPTFGDTECADCIGTACASETPWRILPDSRMSLKSRESLPTSTSGRGRVSHITISWST